MDRFDNPFREMDELRRAFDRVFGPWPGASAFLPGRSARGYPLLNVAEEEDAFVIEALAPGLDRGSLEVRLERDLLTISGEKKPLQGVSPEAYHRSERSTGRFTRTLRLEAEIQPDGIAAEYRDGILKIRLPKSPRAVPRKIAVNVK